MNKKYFLLNMIYFTAMICVAVIFVLGYLGFITNNFIATILIQVVTLFAIPTLMYTIFISKNIKQTFHDCGFKKISKRIVLITILIGFVCFFLNCFVANLFSGIISLFGYENLYQSSSVQLTYKVMLQELILSCLFPAIFEEFLHRGVMLHAGKKHSKNTMFCLLISSILFGFLHMNINQFFYATILGLLMGYVSIISDSIYPAMIIHFMNNFISTCFSFGVAFNWPISTLINNLINSIFSANIIIFVITFTLLIMGLIWLFILLTRRITTERTKSAVSKIINELQLENLSFQDAQIKIEEADKIISQYNKNSISTHIPKGNKIKFIEIVFILSSVILGTIITASSFIWGIM